MPKAIEVSDDDYRLLEELGRNYFSQPGWPPLSPGEVVQKLIDRTWEKYKPMVFIEPGFDRK